MSSSTTHRSDAPDRAGSNAPRPGTLSASTPELYERVSGQGTGSGRDSCVVFELQRPGPVDLAVRLRTLEDLARRLGIDVRHESLRGSRSLRRGGLCRLRSRHVIFVDATATLAEQVGVLLDALAQPELEPVLATFSVRLELDRLVP